MYWPKVIGVNDPDYAAMAESFFAGVDSHEQAAAVWNAHLVDVSVCGTWIPSVPLGCYAVG